MDIRIGDVMERRKKEGGGRGGAEWNEDHDFMIE
jgi:hypothetical protein